MTKGSKSLGYLLIIFPKHALNNVLSIAHRVESCIVHAINIVIWGGGWLACRSFRALLWLVYDWLIQTDLTNNTIVDFLVNISIGLPYDRKKEDSINIQDIPYYL